jgi:hypothetical protein
MRCFWANFSSTSTETEQRISGENDATDIGHAGHFASSGPRPGSFVAF